MPLPLFVLTFCNDEDIKRIYQIKDILHMKVDIEAFRKPKLIPQCKNCQEYGHTQKYCGREARCVKCAGRHHTKECKKPKETKAKCIHCGEAHPANYRGCNRVIALQELRNKNNKKLPEKRNTNTEATNMRPIWQRQVEADVSYAQVTKGGSQQESEKTIDPITLMLQRLMNQMEQQEKKQEEFKQNNS